ncbi:MAG TPA: hypothetical protein P5228_02360 [Bacteroidales bacterium]|nr:hypothetical protein [Bacteroidales bacterium]HRZ48593.1 hypothetical protein [Bacteroidales bacterium]
MNAEDQRFIRALETADKALLQSVPRSDLHCHAGLSFRLEVLERWAGKKITPPPSLMESLAPMNRWITEELTELYQDRKCFEFSLKAALAEAWNDGITLLEMSIDVSFIGLYENDPMRFTRFIREAHQVVAPEVDFRPELGIARDADPGRWLPLMRDCIETGVFRSIDLYGTEDARPPEMYAEMYQHARSAGLKCKMHSGEFGTAASMEHDLNVLRPDAIQHGIAAASSQELMRRLADEGTVLNVCPTSNIRLSRVTGYRHHPIRTLFDAGIQVTLNSDDIMVFGSLVSDEYLHLFTRGVMNAEELNQIRITGLSQ